MYRRRAPSTASSSLAFNGRIFLLQKEIWRSVTVRRKLTNCWSQGRTPLPHGVSCLFPASAVPGVPWGQPRTLKKLRLLCSVRRTWSGHFAESQRGTLLTAISSLSLDCCFIFILKISARQSILEARGGFLPSADFILSFFLSPFSSLCSTPSVSVSFSRSRQRLRKSVLNIHWKDWCWSWSSNTLATWCGELTHWKSPWCWERLKAGGEGGDREEWVGWMASPTRWTQLWASSGSWWWTESLVCCSPWGRKESDTTERLNWTELKGFGDRSLSLTAWTCQADFLILWASISSSRKQGKSCQCHHICEKCYMHMITW